MTRPTRRFRIARAACFFAVGLAAGSVAGCGRVGVTLGDLGAGATDLSAETPPPSDGGVGVAVFAEVGFSGCPSFSLDGGTNACIGTAPLSLTLVPVAPGNISDFHWTFDGGVPESSSAPSPSVLWAYPGSYGVQLVVSGPGGMASAQAQVRVLPNGTGGPCRVDAQCGAGLSCFCGASVANDAGIAIDPGDAGAPSDGGAIGNGVACPAELENGLCSASCSGGSCAGTDACVDLQRSIAGDGSVAMQYWRQTLCLPACKVDADCRPGFACRVLPVLTVGEYGGGNFVWSPVCFAAGVLGDDGYACASESGTATPSSCVGGLCASLGARDLCTSPCAVSPCPGTAVCATFNDDPTDPICIPRCDKTHPCADPLLDCKPQSAVGNEGYTVPQAEPANATYCAPRVCTVAADCAPAGHCIPQNVGPSYCAR